MAVHDVLSGCKTLYFLLKGGIEVDFFQNRMLKRTLEPNLKEEKED
jgi:hypothetical protein